MQHASEATLEVLTPLLDRLRSVDGLVEKRPGVFYRRSKAFLHFHEDPAGIFVDVRFHLEDRFERLRVSSDKEQSALVSKVQRALRTEVPSSSSPNSPRSSSSK
jgi:hypothetical protein